MYIKGEYLNDIRKSVSDYADYDERDILQYLFPGYVLDPWDQLNL